MISRTVLAGQPVGLAPAGVVACTVPLAWPNKSAAEVLDYAVDFSAEFTGDATVDTIASQAVAIVPGDGSLAASALANAGQVVSLRLSAGVAATQYSVMVTATMTSGRVVNAQVGIYVTT